MNTIENIGIVGAQGDLGSKLVVQVSSAFENTYAFDTSPNIRQALRGIDPNLEASVAANQATIVPTLEEVLDSSTIVHWTAPIESVDTIPRLPESSMLVLHDSVMNNSLEAARQLRNNKAVLGQIAVAHCLMNEERTVVVATDVKETDRVVEHIKELGLQPELMSAKEHDITMAHSQALFAIICKLYRQELEGYAKRGVLTPSGQRLLTAMEDNESRWTHTTFATITSNPEISSVIHSMLEVAEEQSRLR